MGGLSPGWISVEDQMPDIGQRILATDGMFVGEAYLRGHQKSFYRPYEAEWNRVFDNPVTHWMPLPQPPKEMQKKNDG